jgi:hypothetical protein
VPFKAKTLLLRRRKKGRKDRVCDAESFYIHPWGAMMIRGMIWVAVLAVGLYTVSCLALYVFQRRLLYFPDPAHYTPQQAGLVGAEEISLATPDGERLTCMV